MESLLEEISLNVRFVNDMHNLNNSNHPLPWRKLFDFELLFVTKGEILVKTKTETYAVKENQLHIMPPNIYHTRFFNDDIPCDYMNAHLDFFPMPKSEEFSVDDTYRKWVVDANYKVPSKLKRRGLFENISVPNVIDIKDSETFKTVFLDMFNAFKSNDRYKNILVKQYAYRMFYQILVECDNQNITFLSYKKNPHIKIIDAYLHYVDSKYAQEIDLDAFAHKYGISRNYFSSIFKKQLNITPHEYVTKKRLDEAKKLLKTGMYSVSEISLMVGYEEVAYFSRVFKIKEGVSPLNYLKLK